MPWFELLQLLPLLLERVFRGRDCLTLELTDLSVSRYRSLIERLQKLSVILRASAKRFVDFAMKLALRVLESSLRLRKALRR